MQNRPVFFVFLIAAFFMCVSSYGDTLDIADRAKLGGVYSLERLNRYADAIPIITDLYHRYPGDLEIKLAYARVLGFGGQLKESEKVFDELCAKGCNTDELMTYARVLEAQRSNPEAMARLKTVLKSSADDDENTLLSKARLLSWKGDTRLSVDLYKRLIQEHPNQVLYYREGARVMGWAGDTAGSTSLYNEACQRFPDDQALHAEAQAKKAYYNNLFFQAEKSYHQWLVLEPDNPEALFDLGQIHARSYQYGAASKDYAELLSKYPNDVQAQAVLDKAQAYDQDWRIEGGFLRDEADSRTRQVDYRLYDAYENLEKSFLGNMVFGIKTDEMDYSFPAPLSNVQRYRYMASLEQDFLPDTFWKLGYGLSNSSNDDKELQYRNAEVQFPILTERLLLNVSYNRDDFIQNEQMLAEHLQEDRYRARATLTPIKPLEFGIDEAHSIFTDGNSEDNFGGDVAWNLLYDPNRLTLKYRWQDWRFKETEPDYFSPSDFPSQRVSLEWEQFLNKNNLYWGANGFSYFLRYEFIMDHGDQEGHAGAVGLNWHINKRLTLRVEARHIYYDHPGIYADDEQTISLIFVF